MIGRRSIFSIFTGGIASSISPPKLSAVEAKAESSLPTPVSVKQEEIWSSYYAGTRIWGYVDKHSVVPGEGFDIMLSAGPGAGQVVGKVKISRIGDYPNNRKLVWESGTITVAEHEITNTAAAIGPAWPPALENVNTLGWEGGYYTIEFVDDKGRVELHVTSIIVTNPGKSGDILLKLSTNTYQAYNAWGGHSLYKSGYIGNRGQMVSFDRPVPPSFFEYEFYLALWLEKTAANEAIKIDYATNYDLHRDANFSEGYKVLICGSHDEYWTKEEFDNIYRRVFDLGKNTIFFGANTAYCQIRYADVNGMGKDAERGRQLLCYKAYDPVARRAPPEEARLLVTRIFRDDFRRPEIMLTGAAYQSYFTYTDPLARYRYTVQDTNAPFFSGIGYKIGDTLPEIVGYEWDNTDPVGDGRRLWLAGKSAIPLLERQSINVLFSAEPVDLNGKPGRAEAVHFVSPAGAQVFTAGSIRWAWGLGKEGFEDEKFKTFNRSLLMYFLGRS